MAGSLLFGRMVLGRQELGIPHVSSSAASAASVCSALPPTTTDPPSPSPGSPQISVPDIRYVDWAAVKAAGFRGCVFDKDNTITEPYALEVYQPLRDAMRDCLEVFDGKVVLLSNSAGLYQYDPEGHEADRMEAQLGIKVLRHAEKKPAGAAHELEEHFACPASEMVMVGDRYFTDVAYGNRHGMLTVRVQPITLKGEKATVRLSRSLEDTLVGRWSRGGSRAPAHELLKPGVLTRMVRAPGIW